MDIQKMMDAIDATVDGKHQAKTAEQERIVGEMLANDRKVAENLKNLRDIVPVLRKLFTNNLVKYHGTFDSYCDWITDSWNHNLGFFKEDGKINFSHFGVNGGGAWYDSVCVDINSGLWLHSRDSVYHGVQWSEPMGMEDFAAHDSRPRYENCRPI